MLIVVQCSVQPLETDQSCFVGAAKIICVFNMSELGKAGGVDAAGQGEHVTHRAGLQCVLKPRAPSTHRDGSLNHLKHILDSVPFTPSQGVRTPSPRHCMVRFSRLLTQSFVHATTAAAGSELVVHSSIQLWFNNEHICHPVCVLL